MRQNLIKWSRFFLKVFFLICVIFLWQPLEAEEIKPEPLSEALLNQGLNLYSANCAACHGQTGKGDGLAAYLLYPKPRNFTKNIFRIISTKSGQPTDEDLFKTITNGNLGSSMPPWKHLPDAERWALVYAVRYFSGLDEALQNGKIEEKEILKPKWEIAKKVIEDKSNVGEAIQIPNETVLSDKDVELGKSLYEAGCASCHGIDGKGNVPQLFKDESGFPIEARDFTQGVFKGGSAGKDLYLRLSAGIPGSPMPSYSAAYDNNQLWALVHYVQTFVNPAAQKENQQEKSVIHIKKVQAVASEPGDKIWDSAQKSKLALMPLWWHAPRISHITVQAIHDNKKIALKLSWTDTTQNNSVIRPDSFTDAVSIQLTEKNNLPLFAMGDSQSEVNLWLWRAADQNDVSHFRDTLDEYPNMADEPMYLPFKDGGKNNEEPKLEPENPKRITANAVGNPMSHPNKKNGAQDLNARGFGSLTFQKLISQNVTGTGLWKNGSWEVVLTRDLIPVEKSDVRFVEGKNIPIAFAVWDGEARERNGQKSVTIWHEAKLE